ncbi:hypothetical protein [Streptomyces sp. YIM 130001]|nr:hypothetical protein [Streptomyces sp. YIM 130001]
MSVDRCFVFEFPHDARAEKDQVHIEAADEDQVCVDLAATP